MRQVVILETVQREIEQAGVNEAGEYGCNFPLPPRADFGYKLNHEHVGN
jgi:hypothetical protein